MSAQTSTVVVGGVAAVISDTEAQNARAAPRVPDPALPPDGEARHPHLGAAESRPARPALPGGRGEARAVQLDPVAEGPHPGQAGAHVLERDPAAAGRLGGRREV